MLRACVCVSKNCNYIGALLKVTVISNYLLHVVMFLCVEGHQLVIDFKAYKERLLEEMFNIYSAHDKRKTIAFVFHARILGKYQLLCSSKHFFY